MVIVLPPRPPRAVLGDSPHTDINHLTGSQEMEAAVRLATLQASNGRDGEYQRQRREMKSWE